MRQLMLAGLFAHEAAIEPTHTHLQEGLLEDSAPDCHRLAEHPVAHALPGAWQGLSCIAVSTCSTRVSASWFTAVLVVDTGQKQGARASSPASWLQNVCRQYARCRCHHAACA